MVRVGRSKSPSGPFKDKTGDVLTAKMKSPAGSIVLSSHGKVYAPGGTSHIPLPPRLTLLTKFMQVSRCSATP